MLIQSQNLAAKRDIGKRQHLMVRCFVRSKRYGYKRVRWRRLWRVQIQEYLTCAIQNIMVLVRNTKEQDSAAQARLTKPRPKEPLFRSIGSTSGQGSANYGYFTDSLLKNIEFFIHSILPITHGRMAAILATNGAAVEISEASFGG